MFKQIIDVSTLTLPNNNSNLNSFGTNNSIRMILCKNTEIEGYYIDQYNTKSYINCSTSCKSCYNSADNCTECNIGYIKMEKNVYIETNFLINNKNTFICFPDSLSFYHQKSNLYFYKDIKENIYKKCDEQCEKCSGDSFTCISCKSGYFRFEDNLTVCKMPNRTDNIYYNENYKIYYYLETVNKEKIFRPCYKNCFRCFGPGTNVYQNCIDCIDGMFFLPNKLDNNCYEKPENYYYLDDGGKKLIAYADNCKKCDKKGCSECEKLFFKFNENVQSETKCRNDYIQGYYTDITSQSYRNCDIKCLNCVDKENVCTGCNNKKGFYLLEEKYKLNITKFSSDDCYNKCPPAYRIDNSNKFCKDFLFY